MKVTSLEFHGVHAIDERRLKEVLATQDSGWLPWSRRAYFDQREFEADLKRVIAFYADRGYPNARVTSVNIDPSQDLKSVRLSITIDEGEPIIVDRIILTGFEVLSEPVRAQLRADIRLQPGAPRDLEYFAAARDTARHVLRESGYAYATVTAKEGPAEVASRVVVELAADPGPMSYFGPVQVEGLKTVRGILVHRAMRFSTGDPYRESLVLRSQRRIASLEIFDFVHVKTEPPSGGGQPTSLPTLVTVTEAAPRRLEFGVGYGSEDRFRASAQWRNSNLGGAGQQFTALGKWSSTLSGVSATYSYPYPFRLATAAEGKVYAWWTNIPAYDTQSYGGAVNVAYRLTTARIHQRESRSVLLRVGYRHEFQRYQLTPEGTEDLSFAEKIALGFDPITGRGAGTLGSIWTTIDFSSVDQLLDPRRGYSGHVRLEHAAPWLGGTFRFDSGLFEARGYYPVGAFVAAARLQLAAITSRTVDAVPISERLFLGGTNNMRGWGRFEVSPLSEGGLPIGGRSALSITGELRRMFNDSFGAAAFLEAGNVWAGTGEFHPSLLYDVGGGVRWMSPVGIVRGDVAWQLTPLPGLQVDNQLLTQRWRIQISIGQAF